MASPTKLPEFIKSLSASLKTLNSPKDLVEMGLSKSEKTLANKRFNGAGPDYIKIKGGGVFYPKNAVLDWLREDAVYISRIRMEDAR